MYGGGGANEAVAIILLVAQISGQKLVLITHKQYLFRSLFCYVCTVAQISGQKLVRIMHDHIFPYCSTVCVRYNLLKLLLDDISSHFNFESANTEDP
jgi:hypothetical protein